ncbi:hypothetical protein ACOMHN_022156 [Nucella lapillus]
MGRHHLALFLLDVYDEWKELLIKEDFPCKDLAEPSACENYRNTKGGCDSPLVKALCRETCAFVGDASLVAKLQSEDACPPKCTDISKEVDCKQPGMCNDTVLAAFLCAKTCFDYPHHNINNHDHHNINNHDHNYANNDHHHANHDHHYANHDHHYANNDHDYADHDHPYADHDHHNANHDHHYTNHDHHYANNDHHYANHNHHYANHDHHYANHDHHYANHDHHYTDHDHHNANNDHHHANHH